MIIVQVHIVVADFHIDISTLKYMTVNRGRSQSYDRNTISYDLCSSRHLYLKYIKHFVFVCINMIVINGHIYLNI